MGARMSWLVADADQIERIAEIIGYRRHVEDASPPKSPCKFGVTTPSGKVFLFEECGWEWDFISPGIQSAISAETTVYFMMNDTTMMMSSAEQWRDGAKVWGVYHQSDEGVYHLPTEGDLPASFKSIRARRFAEQKELEDQEAQVDAAIKIPLDLAAAFTGYDGGMNEPEGDDFVLIRKPRIGFLRRIFGRNKTS